MKKKDNKLKIFVEIFRFELVFKVGLHLLSNT
jgi:hypothetical protein